MEIGTAQTWAYINAQLDFPKSKQVRVHIINEGRTLCGLPARSYWETAEVDTNDFLGTWPCLRCKRSRQAGDRRGRRRGRKLVGNLSELCKETY